jgi:hypothetical protein
MERPILAFAIAPLWVPAAVAPYATLYLFPYAAQAHWVVIATVVSAFFAYLGTLAIGLPVFLLLRAKQITSIWAGIVLGFVVGGVTWLVFELCFGLSLGNSVANMAGRLQANWLPELSAFGVTGTLGMLVGVTIWLIARPRRLGVSNPKA